MNYETIEVSMPEGAKETLELICAEHNLSINDAVQMFCQKVIEGEISKEEILSWDV